MVMDGQWRGGLVPYGYRLEFLGRTNKKNQLVRDLVIDEAESSVMCDSRWPPQMHTAQSFNGLINPAADFSATGLVDS